MTPEQLRAVAEALADPDPGRFLPEDERRHYEECQASVVKSRREAERESYRWWVG